ncbi:MAG: FAD-dependent oxidoreductase [bacterium]
MIIIAGGGMTGLSAAHHIQASGQKYVLLEKAGALGGLCRSIRKGGYTFDWSGHLFCPREHWVISWVEELLNGDLLWFQRESCVHVKGENIPFPIQAHLGALPRPYLLECLASFLRERAQEKDSQELGTWPDWISTTFGKALAQLFFFPYHEKLWGVPLEELSAQGLEWSVPRPTVEEVVDGALGVKNPLLGYNANLSYPSNGGIEEIPKAMARELVGVYTLSSLQRVLWKQKQVVVKGFGKLSYRKLISTIPLSALLRLLEPPVEEEILAFPAPRAVSIWVLNVGIKRPSASHYHWIYFPEKEFPFFRVGCYTAFGAHLAPPGRSSFYVEIPCHVVCGLSKELMVERTLKAMVRCGILKSTGEVEIVLPVKIPVAYVIHDVSRSRWLPRVLFFLESHGIRCAGRYGAWGYGTMEHAIIQGREAAQWAVEE